MLLSSCMISNRLFSMLLLASWFTALPLHVARADMEPEVVLDGLNRPCGVAIQPDTGIVFLAESGGGRVIRIVDGAPQEVVSGFPLAKLTHPPSLELGPLSLLFINSEVLVVTAAGANSGEEILYLVQVPPLGAPPLSADECSKLGPLAPAQSQAGGDNFMGIVQVGSVIYLGAWDSLAGNQICTLPITRATRLESPDGYGKLTVFANAAPTGRVAQAVCLARRGKENEIVVGMAGTAERERDSEIAFFRTHDSQQLLRLATGLYDVMGLCYASPPEANDQHFLYAVDAAWSEPEAGGLFRLDAKLSGGTMAIEPVRLAKLRHPIAIERALDGTLYVTTAGETAPDAAASSGQLLRFAPSP